MLGRLGIFQGGRQCARQRVLRHAGAPGGFGSAHTPGRFTPGVGCRA
jgi:hypothetical protein